MTSRGRMSAEFSQRTSNISEHKSLIRPSVCLLCAAPRRHRYCWLVLEASETQYPSSLGQRPLSLPFSLTGRARAGAGASQLRNHVAILVVVIIRVTNFLPARNWISSQLEFANGHAAWGAGAGDLETLNRHTNGLPARRVANAHAAPEAEDWRALERY